MTNPDTKESTNDMTTIYVAADGDNVGSRLEYLVITNNIEALKEFSTKFNAAMEWFENELEVCFSASMVFFGGDNLLASITSNKFARESLERLRFEFSKRAQSTLSIGIGDTPQQAYLALKLAKTNGKNVIREFRELSN